MPGPFPSVRDETRIAELHKIMFEEPFLPEEQELGVYYKKVLARAIAGHYEDKTFLVGVGPTNTGKGVMSKALEQTFKGFIGNYQGDFFKVQKHTSQDAAKQLSWIQAICNTRLAVSNEPGVDSVYNGVLMKIVASGGDTITTRTNFKDEQNVINRATMLLYCNDLPKIYPLDAAVTNRLVIIEYKLSFVESPSLPHERQVNPHIKDMFFNPEFRDAFFWNIMDAYEPKKPVRCGISMASAAEWTPTPSSSFKDVFASEGYVIDLNDEEAWVPFKELKDVLQNAGAAKGMSDTALGKELGRMGLVSDDMKVKGKKMVVRKFIKKIADGS
jgi:hypothetical protein